MLLGLAAAFAVLIAVRGYARTRVVAVDAATEWVDHTHRVLEAVGAADTRFADAQLGHRGYLLRGDSASVALYRASAAGVDSALAQLRTLTRDNRAQQRRIDSLATFAHGMLGTMRTEIALRDARGAEAARGALIRGKPNDRAEPYRALSARIAADEQALLAARAARRTHDRDDRDLAMRWGAFVVLVLCVAAAGRVRSALIVRAGAERERDEHAQALVRQSAELEEQNHELTAQGEALRQAMDQAEGANHAKSMFLAQMSHELRTPLNSVIGFANIVRRNPHGTLSARELTYLERIGENGRQLLRTINSILDLSKIEAEQESVELEMVSLDVLVREVLAQLEPQAAAGRVELVAELPAPVASVVSDTEKLRRVLINLVANAVKFTRAGGRVLVRVETAPRARTTPVAIEVRDTGIGIPPDRLASIFEAFEQGDVGVAREYGGTGLGLSISRALCRLLHCDLTVSSVPGEGSVFRIALPLDGALASLPPASDMARLRAVGRLQGF